MIKDLTTLKKYFQEKVHDPIFGVGVYAFNRLGFEDFIPNYRLLALRYGLDSELIEKDIELLSLEKGMGTRHIQEPRNSTTVMRLEKTKEYVSQFTGNPAMITYSSSVRMEQVCKDNDWTLVAIPSKFGKKMFEDKIKFRQLLEEAGVSVPPGEIALYSDFDYDKYSQKYGTPFVLQHPRLEGGKGTFFINNKREWDEAVRKIAEPKDSDIKKEENIDELELIVAKYISGPSPSISCCATRHGILTTKPQYQIIDIPELFSSQRGSGLFCGHDWTASDFSENIKKQAYEIAEEVGKRFQEKGYKGIFGIDFVLDEEKEKLYVIEANPRLLGTFPVITMAQILNGEPPLAAFHLLEYLNVEYELDLEAVNRLMRQDKKGAHLTMHNLERHYVKNHQAVKPGVYKIKNDSIKYLRPGYALKHIKNDEEFVVTEGLPYLKSHFSPDRRIARILTLAKVTDGYNKLNPWAYKIVEEVYRAFDFRKVKYFDLIKFFYPNYLSKG